MRSPKPSIEDERAIEAVTIRYCWALDERNWDDLEHVFTEDAVAELGSGPPLRGLPRIRSYIAAILDPLDTSQHMVSNHQIERDGNGMRSRCYFQAQHVRKGLEGGSHYVVAGIYRDSWTASGSGWRIRARKLEVLWTQGNAAVVTPRPGEA